MHIGMIYAENRRFPPDIRVEKEINSLCAAGHRVTVLAKRIPPDAPTKEKLVCNNAKVNRVVLNKPSFYEELWRLIALQNKNWLPLITNFIHENAPDVIHVHDFNLVPTTLRACRRLGVPVIADLHENMPAAKKAFRRALKPLPRFVSSIAFNYYLWRWHESTNLPRCTRVIVVVPEAAQRLFKYGIKKDKIVIISNTEDETTFHVNQDKIDLKIVKKYRAAWMISYIGGLGPHRGLDTTIRAIPQAAKAIPNLRIVVVGVKKGEREQLQKYIKHCKAEKWVEIIEWQPFDQVVSYMMASRACLVPHNNFEHTQTTIPHKLFQYMICGKPVIVSDCKPLSRIVNETQAGLVFEAGNSKDLAAKIVKLYREPQTSDRMGRNGKIAALGAYAWRHDAKKLTDLYAALEIKNLNRKK
jgi:glycosyltransferase involved in cell wall biosynthesis